MLDLSERSVNLISKVTTSKKQKQFICMLKKEPGGHHPCSTNEQLRKTTEYSKNNPAVNDDLETCLDFRKDRQWLMALIHGEALPATDTLLLA